MKERKGINGVHDSVFAYEIAKALHERGGAAECQCVIDEIRRRVGARLSREAFEKLDDGQIRWENRVKFVRDDMKKKGLILNKGVIGRWQLTPKGTEEYIRWKELKSFGSLAHELQACIVKTDKALEEIHPAYEPATDIERLYEYDAELIEEFMDNQIRKILKS